MHNPDGQPGGTGERRLSPEERRRVTRAAFLRPMGLFVVVIGAIFFALTLSWWAVVLTLATYAALAFLATRDPLFWAHVLEGREYRLGTRPVRPADQNVPPERRVRRLPRGETRRKVEEALELHRRTIVAIEGSDAAARSALGDAVPKLHRVIGRLADVAERREEVAGRMRNLENRVGARPRREDRDAYLAGLENELRAADEEISRTVDDLSSLRPRVIRVSVESEGAAQEETAARLNANLDEMSLRLDALRSDTSPPEHPGRR